MACSLLPELSPGMQLAVRYAIYHHHGIYVGGGRVIHYAGWIRGRRGLIEEVAFDEFTEGLEWRIERVPPDRESAMDVVRRARARLGERCYDLLRNNCEHFCNWCELGESRSEQIELMGMPMRVTIWVVQTLWSLFVLGANRVQRPLTP
jgi:hypothetical protein